MASDTEMDDEDFLALILSNLFRKESNGDAIQFFVRKKRLGQSQNSLELEDKLKKLKHEIERCGGFLGEEPSGCHSIELVFPENIDNLNDIDSDIFRADYVEECVKCGELLDLEDFRLGKSPYSSININMIMKGHESWDSVSRTSPQKGRKLPDFGPPLQKSPNSLRSNVSTNKGRRVEYSIEEDLAILKLLLSNNLYDKVGGNATWKIVHRQFPNHSYQSLHNRFRRFILPNLDKYKGLTNSERNLFNRGVSSDSSSMSSPKKTIQTDTCNPIRNSPLTAEKVAAIVDQETVLATASITEKVSERNPKEAIRENTDVSLKMQTSLNKGKTLLLRSVGDVDMEENSPLTPNTLEMILSNLFRKESDGDAIEFYMRRNRFSRFQNSVELEKKCKKLKEQIEKCGGLIGEIPTTCHSIELVFPEVIGDTAEIESDVFKAEYVEACLKCGDLLDLEDFRLGESPYDGSININSIMKGNDSWESVTKKDLPKGRKLLEFGSSPEAVKDVSPKKKRIEYSIEEDLAILKFLLSKNLHDKVGGNATWKIVQGEFPNHPFESLRNRFRRHILPNLDAYMGLTNSERNLFLRGSSSDDSCTFPPKATHRSDTCSTLHNKNQDDLRAGGDILDFEKEASHPVSIPAASKLSEIVVDETSTSTDDIDSCDSGTSTVSSTKRKKTKERGVGEFTVEVDKCILKYIVMHNRYTEVSGRKLWMDMQQTIFKKRDWKCIKQRFHDVILKDLESEEYSLDRNAIRKFRSKKFSSSSEQDISFEEDDSSTSSYPKTRKAAPRPYTVKEDKLIVDYIVRKERYEEIRGKLLWVDIQDKVLHEYNRSWESAKNRFLRTIFKNLSQFRLNADIVAKFRRGAVVQRHLGGVKDRITSRNGANKKYARSTEESEDDTLPKHPALASNKIATPSKKPKRQLFRQPIIPLPVLFTQQSGPSLTKEKGDSSKVYDAKLESAAAAAKGAERLLKSPELLASTATPSPTIIAATIQASLVRDTSSSSHTFPKRLRPAPSVRCAVVLKRLTNAELEKYGCKATVTQKTSSPPTRTDSSVVVPPVTILHESPPKASRFTVEISTDLFAARLSAAGSPVSALASQESGWLPLSTSLSRESIRHSSQRLQSFLDTSACTTDVSNKFQQPSVTGASSNIEHCGMNDGAHDETDVHSQVSLTAKSITCDPIRTQIPTHSYLELSKDDLSSDGYRTPEG